MAKPLGKKKGVLLSDYNGGVFFRVYEKNHDFTDYNIIHHDLDIEINDSDAYVYEKDGDLYIDHSPETLGIKENIDYVAEFEKRFGDINQDNIYTVAIKDPNFLFKFISFAEIKPFTKAIALSNLGCSFDKTYLEFIKSYTKNEISIVREGAYQGCAEYYFNDHKKYPKLLDFFKEALLTEKDLMVIKQINNLIMAMQMCLE